LDVVVTVNLLKSVILMAGDVMRSGAALHLGSSLGSHYFVN